MQPVVIDTAAESRRYGPTILMRSGAMDPDGGFEHTFPETVEYGESDRGGLRLLPRDMRRGIEGIRVILHDGEFPCSSEDIHRYFMGMCGLPGEIQLAQAV